MIHDTLRTFIPKSHSKKALTKAEIMKIHPSAKYSGKTLYDKEGNITRKPGFYV